METQNLIDLISLSLQPLAAVNPLMKEPFSLSPFQKPYAAVNPHEGNPLIVPSPSPSQRYFYSFYIDQFVLSIVLSLNCLMRLIILGFDVVDFNEKLGLRTVLIWMLSHSSYSKLIYKGK